MKSKFVYGLLAVVAGSTASVLAADETNAMTLEERVAALEQSANKSDWSENITLKGDMRYRYEYIGVDGDTAKSDQRIRARIGAYADVNDFTKAGIRLRTGSHANSGNQTIGQDFDNKGVYVDLAYISMMLNDGKCGELTLGKMKFPWETASALIWDDDVNPEGIAYSYDTKRDNTSIFANASGMKVQDMNSNHDLNLVTLQAGASQPINDDTKVTVGGSLFAYDNAAEFGYPVDYKILEAFSELALADVIPVPLKLYGDYVNNTAIGDDKQGICLGAKFGDKKKGKWEAKAEYRYLEANAAPSNFADSDFVGGGTDVNGVGVKAAYNLGKHLTAGINANTGQRITTGTDVSVLLLDLVASF